MAREPWPTAGHAGVLRVRPAEPGWQGTASSATGEDTRGRVSDIVCFDSPTTAGGSRVAAIIRIKVDRRFLTHPGATR
jgi:hypothetical protein